MNTIAAIDRHDAAPRQDETWRVIDALVPGRDSGSELIRAACRRLAQSPTGMRSLRQAAAFGATIEPAEAEVRAQGSIGGYFPPSRSIKIDETIDPDLMVGTLAHELRHVAQDQRGLLRAAQMIPEERSLPVLLAIEADAEAAAAAICIELSERGDHGPLLRAQEWEVDRLAIEGYRSGHGGERIAASCAFAAFARAQETLGYYADGDAHLWRQAVESIGKEPPPPEVADRVRFLRGPEPTRETVEARIAHVYENLRRLGTREGPYDETLWRNAIAEFESKAAVLRIPVPEARAHAATVEEASFGRRFGRAGEAR